MSRPRANPYLTTVSKDYIAQQFKRDETVSLARLNSALENIWDFGRNVVVGWTHGPNSIDLCYCPLDVAIKGYALAPRVFEGERLFGNRAFDSMCERLGMQRFRVDTAAAIGGERYTIHATTINNLVKRYSITHTRNRAVILFDIVKFSLLEPVEQLDIVRVLEYYINKTSKIMADLELPVDLHRSTTGDGYYVWNGNLGPEHNVRTYIALVIILVLNANDGFRINLRAAFSIGSHFTYHHVDSVPRGIEYIVGDVTIRLSRIVNSCLENQVLTSYFADDKKNTTILDFMEACQAHIDRLQRFEIESNVVSVLRTYLTGNRCESGFEVQTYCITDKHGISHIVCNVKINAYFIGAEPVKIGRTTAELAEFDHLVPAS